LYNNAGNRKGKTLFEFLQNKRNDEGMKANKNKKGKGPGTCFRPAKKIYGTVQK
jgi:hypothetical protein